MLLAVAAPGVAAKKNHNVTCVYCEGSGEVQCAYCHGAGTVDCNYCRGTGFVKCNYCDGTGKIRCEDCLGKGISFVSSKGREQLLFFLKWVSPLEEINRVLRQARS